MTTRTKCDFICQLPECGHADDDDGMFTRSIEDFAAGSGRRKRTDGELATTAKGFDERGRSFDLEKLLGFIGNRC